MLATVVILPVVVLAIWLGLQAGLVMHARNTARAAAEDAAVAAATGSGDPTTIANSVGTGWATDGISVSTARSGDSVTVTVTANVRNVTGIGSWTVTESASAPIEEFIPEGQRP